MSVGARRWPTRRHVVVNLEDGRALDGILYAKRGPLLELRNAQLFQPGSKPVPVDGAVIVERPKITFIQICD
jgi:hypothetical protein